MASIDGLGDTARQNQKNFNSYVDSHNNQDDWTYKVRQSLESSDKKYGKASVVQSLINSMVESQKDWNIMNNIPNDDSESTGFIGQVKRLNANFKYMTKHCPIKQNDSVGIMERVRKSQLFVPKEVYMVNLWDPKMYVDKDFDYVLSATTQITTIVEKDDTENVDLQNVVWNYIYKGYDKTGGFDTYNGKRYIISNIGTYIPVSKMVGCGAMANTDIEPYSSEINDFIAKMGIIPLKMNNDYWYKFVAKSFLRTFVDDINMAGKNDGIVINNRELESLPKDMKIAQKPINDNFTQINAYPDNNGGLYFDKALSIQISSVSVDHLNGDHSDNRAENLQLKTMGANGYAAQIYKVVRFDITDVCGDIKANPADYYFRVEYVREVNATMPVVYSSNGERYFGNDYYTFNRTIENSNESNFSNSGYKPEMKVPVIIRGNQVMVTLYTLPVRLMTSYGKNVIFKSIEEFAAQEGNMSPLQVMLYIKKTNKADVNGGTVTLVNNSPEGLNENSNKNQTISSSISETEESASDILLYVANYDGSASSTNINKTKTSYIELGIDERSFDVDSYKKDGEEWFVPKIIDKGIVTEFPENFSVKYENIPEALREYNKIVVSKRPDARNPKTWSKGVSLKVKKVKVKKEKFVNMCQTYVSNFGRIARFDKNGYCKISLSSSATMKYPHSSFQVGRASRDLRLHNIFASTFREKEFWDTAARYYERFVKRSALTKKGRLNTYSHESTMPFSLENMYVHHKNEDISMYGPYNTTWVSKDDNTFFSIGSCIAIVGCVGNKELPLAAFRVYSSNFPTDTLKGKEFTKPTVPNEITIELPDCLKQYVANDKTSFKVNLKEISAGIMSQGDSFYKNLIRATSTYKVGSIPMSNNGGELTLVLRECILQDVRTIDTEDPITLAKYVIGYRNIPKKYYVQDANGESQEVSQENVDAGNISLSQGQTLIAEADTSNKSVRFFSQDLEEPLIEMNEEDAQDKLSEMGLIVDYSYSRDDMSMKENKDIRKALNLMDKIKFL